MSAATLTKVSETELAISGDLMMHTVMQLLKEVNGYFKPEQPLSIDFSRIGNSDSSALALIITWLANAKKQNITIHLNNLPQQILDIAQASDLLDILPID